MTDCDDIISMAREAGIPLDPKHPGWLLPHLERFANLVAAATRESMRAGGWRACAVGQRETQHCGLLETAVLVEREACAKVCEVEASIWDHLEVTGRGRDADKAEASLICAAAIRARGKEQPPQERAPDYLEKCPNCNGPADNGFDRSWPDPNPYFCTKCMKAMEY